MGRAPQELAPHVWSYSGFHADLAQPNRQRCHTLIITFDQNKVADVKLVNQRAVEIIAATLKANRSPSYSVAR